MQILSRSHLCVIGLAVSILAACSPTEPSSQAPPHTTPSEQAAPEARGADDVLAEWQECITQAEDRIGDAQCGAVAGELVALGGPALQAALKQLADPELSPYGKVMIADGFKGRLDASAAGILKPMTAPREDETTRACATALLASISEDSLTAFLMPLTQDPSPRVQFAALLGVAASAEESTEVRAQLRDIYHAPGTSVNQRQNILEVFMRNPLTSDTPFLVSVIQDTTMPTFARIDAASALGRVGDATAIDPLIASKALDPSPEFHDTVDLSIAVIEERAEAERAATDGAGVEPGASSTSPAP